MTLDLTRRQAVKAAVSAAGATYLVGPSLGDILGGGNVAIAASRCATATPELTEGPYWVNTLLRRSDVIANTNGTSKQQGVPLALTINVQDSSNDCAPANGLAVDIWHANAMGLYSDESSQASGGGDSSSTEDTSSDNFLRGYQITGHDKGIKRKPIDGQVSFHTIWPGWYTSRAIHIHVRIRKLHASGATIAGYTTQIFFSDADNDRIFNGASPYNTRAPKDDPTTDESDTVLTKADFATNIVAVTGNIEHGYAATFNVVVTTAAVDTTGSLSRPNAGGGAAPSQG
jgi:protocatechuate 3,4-dioxygenase beta subunit